MIDLRLIFVVLFGSTYGINYGIAAAAAESLSLIRAFEAEGSSWYVLFYEPSNWIPFIFYFAVGAICGYIRMKNKDNVQFIKEENNLLQEKFLFTREMYQETIEDKNLYKKQILGSKDSFGKIFDIFDGEGLTESNKSKSSVHGMEQTIDIAKREFEGLCFVNLVDFDALWGHRRNVKGYAEELERFDVKLGELLDELREDDLLIITADHGNDPTHTGTDHTREKVPFFAYSPSMEGYGKLEDQNTFAVIGATIADNFEVKMPEGTIGSSLLDELK